MKATTKRVWELINCRTRQHVVVQPGTYELERIANPYGIKADWLVIKGMDVGMAEGVWRQWRNGLLNRDGQPIDWGDYEIKIED